MRGGIAVVLGSAVLAVSGCATKPGPLQVRAIGDPASKMGAGSERLAEARGQLVLGNVGLAIEAYHAALREQPDSVEAMKGLAACYDSMGRADLSRHYYEAALAVSPHNGGVLNAFAGSLDASGERGQAAELRSEARQANAPTAPTAASVAAVVEAGASVTIPLSPPRPIAQRAAQPNGPRLQRLSPGEVALLTAGEPAWQPTVIARSARSTTVRWVALNDESSRPNVRLLNAAHSQGLAARTRDYLLARGWRRIEIGDADAVRDTTVVMYPAGRQVTGRSLAGQFGIRAGMLQQGQVIVVLLGRDAAASRIAQARG
jgi:tetratricopeptide (TPR) repeat protein